MTSDYQVREPLISKPERLWSSVTIERTMRLVEQMELYLFGGNIQLTALDLEQENSAYDVYKLTGLNNSFEKE